jgi:hypothetical protein
MHKLFDEIKEAQKFTTDTQLAAFLLLSRAQISMLRAGKKLSPFTLMRLHDKTGRSVEEIRRYARAA